MTRVLCLVIVDADTFARDFGNEEFSVGVNVYQIVRIKETNMEADWLSRQHLFFNVYKRIEDNVFRFHHAWALHPFSTVSIKNLFGWQTLKDHINICHEEPPAPLIV